MRTIVPPWNAYRRAIYRVEAASGAIDLRIGEPSPALDAVLASFDASDWGFVTAVNPGSRRLSEERNAERTARLAARIDALGWRRVAGRGIDPEGIWPDEPSFLVLDAELDALADLGREFGQAAIVVGTPGGAARLVPLAAGGSA